MGAAKKFWALPELGEGLISFLDPLSTLQLAQSDMLDDLETSLTSKVWNELIRRSSLAQPNPNPQSLQKDLNALVRILRFKVHDPDKDFVEREKLSPLMMPLLHQVCEACPWTDVEMVCPCRLEPHSISSEGFLLLEKVEGAFGTTMQSLKLIDSAWRWREMLSAISRGGYRFAKLIETNILEQISMLEHILRLFSIESKWFPSNLAFIPEI